MLFSSCEDVVEIDIEEGQSQLVVDAWITDELKEQKISLMLSQPYFDNSQFKPALGAEVKLILEIINSSLILNFSKKDGKSFFKNKQLDEKNKVIINYVYDVLKNNYNMYIPA